MITKLDKLEPASYLGRRTKKYRVSAKRAHLYCHTYTLYDFYCTLPEEIKKQVTKKQYITIIKAYFGNFMKRIIVDRERIQLARNMGVMRVRKTVIRGKVYAPGNINYKDITLRHSSNKIFIIYWDKNNNTTNHMLKNKFIYAFKRMPKYRKIMATEILKCNKDPYRKDYDALS